MKQIAVRIGGFVVNAGSQTIVLDRNIDVEKSNARSGNFPGKLESWHYTVGLCLVNFEQKDAKISSQCCFLFSKKRKKCKEMKQRIKLKVTCKLQALLSK